MTANIPLPYGWITQVDPGSGHTFYVDTKANPPRSIWTHPYEDEQYLEEHPDVRDKVRGSDEVRSYAPPAAPPPSVPRRHSFGGRPTTPVQVPPRRDKQGFFSKLKAKAMSSLEARNERQRQQKIIQQGQSGYRPQAYAVPGHAYPQPQQIQYLGMGPRMGAPRRHGMGGMGLPFLGGLAGGMLLDDVLDHDYGDNDWGGGDNDWGGGDGFDGGGDWGGGD